MTFSFLGHGVSVGRKELAISASPVVQTLAASREVTNYIALAQQKPSSCQRGSAGIVTDRNYWHKKLENVQIAYGSYGVHRLSLVSVYKVDLYDGPGPIYSRHEGKYPP